MVFSSLAAMNTPPSHSSVSEPSEQSVRSLPPPNRRRDKPQLSCNLCRKRKLRCDRAEPCGTCIKRGLSLSCTYVSHQASDQPQLQQNKQQRKSVYQGLRDKIDQLEQLLFLQGHSANGNATSSPAFPQNQLSSNSLPLERLGSKIQTRIAQKDEAAESTDAAGAGTGGTETGNLKSLNLRGLMEVDDSETGTSTTWVETNHWAAILDGISELKAALTESNSGGPEQLDDSSFYCTGSSSQAGMAGPELLLDSNIFLSHQDMLAALPERQYIDRLLSAFFQVTDVGPMIIHAPTFLDEYEYFWTHQEETSLLWVGILYGIMTMALLSQDQEQQQYQGLQDNGQYRPAVALETDAKRLAYHYRTKFTQCLKLGNYLKPAPYILPSLLMYLMVETSLCSDSDTGVWVLLGMVLRLSLRLGYHRDAADFPQISPFQGEMRRRVWSLLVSVDAGFSTQFGMPMMLQHVYSTSLAPRNLLDQDLSVNMKELPPAQPDSVRTPTQYFTTKLRLIRITGKVADFKHENPLLPGQYEKAMELDRQLQAFFQDMPAAFVFRPMSQSIMDEPLVIFQRFHMAIVFYKTQCVLHRPFMIPSTTEEARTADERGYYAYSRTVCIKAAVQILGMQQTLDEETQLGGRLFSMRSKMSPLIRSDFLFATMLLSADLDTTVRKGDRSPAFPSELDAMAIKALRGAKSIWFRHSTISREARQAHTALTILLGKVDGSDGQSSMGQSLDEDENDGMGSTSGLPTTFLLPSDFGHSHEADEFMMADLELSNSFPIT